MIRPRRLSRATVAAAALVAAACGGGAGASATTTHHPRPAPAAAGRPGVAFVRVTLATVWARPGESRPVDAPSTTRPVDIPRWLSHMSVAQRAWLVGRLQTQAAYGAQVAVLGHSGAWTKVAVRGQATPLNRYGYPGWLPTRQLTDNRSLISVRRSHPVAVVTRKSAWLRAADTFAPRLAVTYATRLPVMAQAGRYDLVATPSGGKLAIARRSVAEYASAAAIPIPGGRRIVAEGKRFLGLPYLWAGTSAYGFDCSGFTYILFRRFGIPLPRDADRQALHGRAVAKSRLRQGDLVFFTGAGGGAIDHVAIYAGSGMALESPHTGDVVKLVPLASLDGYAGARRYL
jgi:cell wall-associated NlpC family hydrolase